MIKIDLNLMSDVFDNVKSTERKRKMHNFHSDYTDVVNRMLNSIEPETYVQPHKHENPDKIEVFIVLKGRALVVEFDDVGEIKQYFILDVSVGNFGVEIEARKWHTVISLESGTVLYEIKPGPYAPSNDKNFAVWAPGESDASREDYKRMILSKCKVS